MPKVIDSKYDGKSREILDVIELFQPIGTMEIIMLVGLERNYAYAIGVIHTLTETGYITRDSDTGWYWYTKEE